MEIEAGFAFEVLQLVKDAQAQHGLRHNSHEKYRKYCSHRLRRLYKQLKFTHGRGRYMKKSLGVAVVSDVRHLHIALYSAERAWSQAMELKEKLQGHGGKQRYHMLRRLRKACKWADLLESLSNEKADGKTAIEATAYAAFMHGSLLLETGADWKLALRKFKKARMIYDELGKCGSIDSQIPYKQRVEEIEPSIRHCLLKLNDENVPTTEEDSDPDFHERLESVVAEAKSQQEISTTTISWLRYTFPVLNNKTRACILKVQGLEKEISTTALEKKPALYDKILAGYQDARNDIREDLGLAADTDETRDNLIGLDKVISCLIFERTIERVELQLQTLRNRLGREQDGVSAALCELVSHLDTLNTTITELSDLATSGRGRQGEEDIYARNLSLKQLLCRGERCYYLAKAYSFLNKHAEAYALVNRALQHAQEAVRSNEGNSTVGDELQDLIARCRTQSALAHAKGVMQMIEEQQHVENGVSSLSLDLKESTYLLDQLDKFKSVLSPPGSKEPPRICQVPPAFRPVPCRPIVLDTALNAIQFPSLEGRLKEKKKGLFGRWW